MTTAECLQLIIDCVLLLLQLSGSYPLSDVKLYCGELDESIDEDTLRAIGSQYSGLQEVVLRRTPSGQGMFVSF